ncbi:similar to Saccharomyces cerevisiae YDR144C MKC7 GPI-anchored aspartyl protease, member of the yapsin family of proteases involved in cell wall growth and maintenance [Maudiozyma saulgeensis]|uniref:Similar to Saccharomyces cerevisiae YDR144C MKC7 GPI-anchored aspartyl protease, member of the yapsin family of proteases involved in cell wall growth and maintenance n=1 Tax=Maudiozyma saulgeensis TaxID=1789683 RepID=A0A1X7R6N1_9SACH|nr:similar to Saccharomyces cerevisiae YDR144C MKC7 GPI-anchored aspartyl protease, member of the yapsin family of proteases involved in cell wall growth and maintenance [Kazachstania saulgeensis]
MKFSKLCIASSLATSTVYASENIKKEDKFVKLKFNKSFGDSYNTSSQSNRPLFKRSSNYEEIELKNQQSFYSVELDIGVPVQQITVLVDTGSSDLWVTGSDNPFCSSNSAYAKRDQVKSSDNNDDDEEENSSSLQEKNGVIFATEITIGGGIDPLSFLTGSDFTFNTGEFQTATATRTSNAAAEATIDCSSYGTFNVNSSSTFKSNETSFEISYGDGSYASGTWGQDVLAMNDVNITGVSFGVANYTNSTVGVLGIGLPGLESTYSGTGSTSSAHRYQYANLPMILRQTGAIEHTAYSLYLDSSDAKYGSVLFGAVDHNKYSGDLYTIPMINIYENQGFSNPIEFDVTLQGIGVSTSDEQVTVSQTKLPALLDSGTTISYMPADLVSLLAEEIGATYSSTSGFYEMRCLSSSDDTELVFDFGGFHITAPLSDFLISTTLSNKQCIFAVVPEVTNSVILGDVFLTHAYVVYDLEKYEISMAQASYDDDTEDIEVIDSSVPSAVTAASYSNTWSTSQDITSGGNIFTLDGNTTVTSGGSTIVTATGSTRSASHSQSTTRRGSSTSRVERTNGQDILSIPTLLLASASFVLSFFL